MTSRVRKRLTAEERKARILAAAVHAFAAAGYDSARMDDIAAGAGITKPVLYDHFPSKQALFLGVLESIRDGLIAKGRLIVEEDLEPERKFRRAVDTFFLFVEQDPEAARVLLTIPSGDPVAAGLSREVQAGASARLAVLLATFMRGAAPVRVQAATEFLKQGLHALAVWWLDHPGVTREELVETVMRITWSGLRTADPHPEPPA
jgi:AcrR family transcriptional regulator